jgi:SAM-dependent methyltransferase
MLTERVGLADVVTHEVGDALELPFGEASFDVVWTQNSGMNIADKSRLYAGFHRVLRPGGTLAFQEPAAGEVSPPTFPLMWADEPDASFLLRPDDLRRLVAGCGFHERAWKIVTESATNTSTALPPAHAGQMLIMGPDRLTQIMNASRRNVAERRIAVVHAVFTR